MSAFAVALIGGMVALAVAYLNGILAESYRRFRDGSALAAGLAGELASYRPAWPLLKAMLDSIAQSISQGQRQAVILRPFERPRDLVFEESVGKLGLLGPELVEDVVFVYSNIRAFRMAFELLTHSASEMSDDELLNRCAACKDALARASERGEPLVVSLRARATQAFAPEWPWTPWIAALFPRLRG